MKILFLTRNYPNKYNPRHGKVIFRQANELIKLGHEVVILSPTPYAPPLIRNLKLKWQEYSKLTTKSKENNIVIHRPRYIHLPIRGFGKYNWKFIQSAILSTTDNIYTNFKFDLIHAHMGYPEGKIGVMLKKRYKVPLVTTFRATDTDVNMKDKKICKQLQNALYNSDNVISPSVPLKRKINSILPDKDIRVIGNGTDPSNKVEIDQTLEFIYKDKNVVLSVSQLIESKGITTNIKAVKELIQKIPNIYYIIIGDGPERSRLEKLVIELELQEYIEFKGNVLHKEAMRFMSICNVFSLPSTTETFGLVYIEAMLNEKPVILCENNGIEGTVVHKESGMVIKENSVEELVNAMYYLLTNKKASNSIAAKGQEIVVGNFLWGQIGHEIETTYRKVLSKYLIE